MQTLSREKLSKIRCSCCGNRIKKYAKLSTKTSIVGYTTICCGCGHITKYVFPDKNQEKEKENIENVLNNNVIISNASGGIRCGIIHGYCDNKSCPYYNSNKHRPVKSYEYKKTFAKSHTK